MPIILKVEVHLQNLNQKQRAMKNLYNLKFKKLLTTIFAILFAMSPLAAKSIQVTKLDSRNTIATSYNSIGALPQEVDTWGYDKSIPLITDAAQLSSNANSKECDSSEGHLLDGDIATYFHTSWSTANGSPLPNANHYLQIHLNKAQQDIMFTYIGMDWASAHNSPQDVTILATNTPSIDNSWKAITELNNMISEPEIYPAYYTSPHIDLGAAYTDIRMVVNQTTTGKTEGTYGRHYFCLSEFQMFQAIKGMVDPGLPISPSAKSAINVVFIGNSITYGATLNSPSTEAPPIKTGEILSKKTQLPIHIRNCGVSGMTTVDWQPNGQLFNNALGAAMSLQKQGGHLFFSMTLGTNDSAEQGPTGAPVSPDNYKKNVQNIINSCLSQFPDATIILNYPIWYSPTTHNSSTYLQAGLDRLISYHPIIDQIVSENQANGKSVYPGIKEAFDFFKDNKSYYTEEMGVDGPFYLHPNSTGAIKLAEFWSQAIVNHIPQLDSIIQRHKSYCLIDSALSVINNCYKCTYNTGDPIITNATDNDPLCQLSTNQGSVYSGLFSNLIDNQPSTFFQSDTKTTLLTDPHYFQIDTKRDTVNTFCFSMKQRTIDNPLSTNSHFPTDITIMASNDTTAGWTHIGGLHWNMPTNVDINYLSPFIIFDRPYRFIRLQVNSTVAQTLSGGGVPYFDMGEIQLYAGSINTKTSDYTTISGMAEACNQLKNACLTFANQLDTSEKPLSTIQNDELEQGIQHIYDLKNAVSSIKNPNIIRNDMDIYTIDGKHLSHTKDLKSLNHLSKGIYIIGNKKVCVK